MPVLWIYMPITRGLNVGANVDIMLISPFVSYKCHGPVYITLVGLPLNIRKKGGPGK